MTKNEFMAFSLPYGLKIKSQHQIFTLHYYKDSVEIINDYDHISIGNLIQENEDKENKTEPHKPILRPLSDLTKEIEHNGETFVPIDELAKMRSSIVENVIPRAFEAIKIDIKSKRLPFDMVLKLIEWKFDIANFIESGEAIDVNTLETNPYK